MVYFISPVDVALIRHPAIDDKPQIFGKILTEWVMRADTTIVTCAYRSEYLKVLRNLRDHVVLHGTARYFPKAEIPAYDDRRDTYIVVAKKSKTADPILLERGEIKKSSS